MPPLSNWKKSPLLKMFNVTRYGDRVNPIFWVFFFAIVVIFLGLVVEIFRTLIYLGGMILVGFVAYFIMRLISFPRK